MSASWRVETADNLAYLPTLPPNSVDAVVCDPPYGLEFMGKEWDGADGFRRALNEADVGRGDVFGRTSSRAPEYRAGRLFQAWCELWGREVLRVLKPGGHLVAFGGTRTHHRLWCGLEDAGFEIRDTITAFGLQWIYGSGFPKSLDVSKALDKATDYALQATVRRAAVLAVEAAGLKLPSNSRWDWTIGEHAPGTAWWALFCAWLPSLSDTERARVEGLTVETVRKTAGWFTTKDIYNITAPATDDAKRWSGWGTALKPAVEPILLARKPLSERNVAANILRWGTGGINVDGCRVEGPPRATGTINLHPPTIGESGIYNRFASNQQQDYDANLPAGRWPPNAVFVHSPSCRQIGERKIRGDNRTGSQGTRPSGFGNVGTPNGDGVPAGPLYGDAPVGDWECADDCPVAELDRQSGLLTSWMANDDYQLPSDNKVYGRLGDRRVGPQNQHGDAGGASRFFPTFRYQAKADTAERNIGLPHGERNMHPTCKPVELMQWLCRLVTPPGGLILDPFTGSGTTGMAALREGFRFLGVEKDPDHAATARLRIEGDAPLLNGVSDAQAPSHAPDGDMPEQGTFLLP